MKTKPEKPNQNPFGRRKEGGAEFHNILGFVLGICVILAIIQNVERYHKIVWISLLLVVIIMTFAWQRKTNVKEELK